MPGDKILIVDDQQEILRSLERLFREDYEVFTATSGRAALEILNREEVAVILSDQRMPEMDGVAFLGETIKLQPKAVRLIITGYADIDATIAAVNKANIYQYISKPFEPDELKKIIRNAVERFHLARENELLHEQLKKANIQLSEEKKVLQQQVEKQLDLGNLIGNSPKMLHIFKLVRKVMDTPTTVLLLGETGTGKELLAKIIHYNSNRKNKMFVAQNCGAIPDTLLQSELFGHVKGAFTGAVKNKKGLFELADKGTIFLDEIGDTSPALQLGLLRVLQEGEIKPVGSNETIKVDVRVIAATNRDINAEVRAGNFREDLFYRLSVFPIKMPALRQRREDIPELVRYFIGKYSERIGKQIRGVEPAVLAKFQQADFPGNIRELENEIERMVTLADEDTIISEDLLSARFKQMDMEMADIYAKEENLKKAIEHLEQSMIRRALKQTKGNILRSAAQLGVSRVGLHKMIKRHEIEVQSFKKRSAGNDDF